MKLALKSPCPVRPELSEAGACRSACALCSKTVHHLSRMTEEQGREVIERSRTEDVCVRYVADRSGSVVFAPALRHAAAAGLLAFAPVALADGGDLVLQHQAEQNRIQDELRHIGVSADQIVVEDADARANADKATEVAGSVPEPEVLVMWDGGI